MCHLFGFIIASITQICTDLNGFIKDHFLLIGFDICIGDADKGNRDNQLSLLNDSKHDLAWNNKAYLNTAIAHDWDFVCGECLSIENNTKNNSMAYIYPTLVENHLNLENVKSIQIISLSGQMILNVQNPGNILDVSWMEKGVYFVRFNGRKVVKIVKT